MKNQRLIDFRENLTLNKPDMASLLEVSLSLYDKVETGERNSSFNFIKKFANKFPDANINYIFFGKEKHEPCSELRQTGTEN